MQYNISIDQKAAIKFLIKQIKCWINRQKEVFKLAAQSKDFSSDKKRLTGGSKKIRSTVLVISCLIAISMQLSSCQLRRTVPDDSTIETATSTTGTTTAATSTAAPTSTSGITTTVSETAAATTTTESAGESTTTAETTIKPSAKPTTNSPAPTTAKPAPTTAKPAPTTVVTTTAKPTAASTGGTFTYKNYGAFFRDQYGSNASIVSGSVEGAINASLDIGSSANGVALVKVDTLPTSVHCVVQIHKDGGMDQFDIQKRGTWIGMPLARGSGTYRILVAYNIGGSDYAVPLDHTFKVSLASGLKPFTASSIIADFSKSSASVSLAGKLCSPESSLDGKIDAVYNWIVKNISYNRTLATQITNKQVTSYIPDPDKTLSSRTGICYDYASLMCAMLRSQGIATRMIMGNTPQGYHAWNEVYIDGTGWVVIAGFSWQNLTGASWVRFDTTFAAGGMTSEQISNNTYTKVKTY
jgi:hypothetical protein